MVHKIKVYLVTNGKLNILLYLLFPVLFSSHQYSLINCEARMRHVRQSSYVRELCMT